MSDENPARRRIMDAIGEETRVPLFNVTEGDLYVLLGFPVAGLLTAAFSGVDALLAPLVGLGIVLGVAAVSATPTHRSAASWLADVGRFYLLRPRVTQREPTNDDTAAQDRRRQSPDRSLSEYLPFTVDETTQELTQIERTWPDAAAVQRTDGTMEAFLEVRPGNMDFAMADDWASVQAAGAAFANDELDFPLTVYATTRTFPTDQLVAQLEERLTDPDVSDNPVFEQLVEEYRRERPDELADTQQVRYYLGVEVAPYEVYERHDDERSPAQRLTTIPVLGVLVRPFVTRRERLTEAELRGRALSKLDDRIRAVQTELVGTVSGWSARRLSTVELFGLALRFWTGSEREQPPVREQVAVDHSSRDTDDA
ncbi:hypothetical protein [Haloparvum sedimenti]|uniref:hypothetical protein n=1 Tax=Haloparvum sedimenti TaxID=1678448 RepID=UPI00071E860C|nr:hypothetical protein [Haloparvum sedimenti]